MKRKLPEKFFEQNQRAKTRKWKFFNLNQALWGAGNREFLMSSGVKGQDACLLDLSQTPASYPTSVHQTTV